MTPGLISQVRRELLARAPQKNRAGPEPWDCELLSPGYAITQRYWTPNQKNMIGTLMFDIDHTDPYGPLLTGTVPLPTFLTHHLANGHAQAGYILRHPVDLQKPNETEFLDDVRQRMVTLWDADPAFTGPLCSGPLAVEYGRVIEVIRPEPVLLRDLAEHLPRIGKPKTVQHGEGRQRTIFETLRFEAYDLVKANVTDQRLWTHLEQLAAQLNGQFDVPLTEREIDRNVKNVALWVTRPENIRILQGNAAPSKDNQGRKRQALAGANRSNRKLSAQREPLPPEQQRANMSAGGALARAAVQEANRNALKAAVTLLQEQGQPVTVAMLQARTRLSRRTIYNLQDLWLNEN